MNMLRLTHSFHLTNGEMVGLSVPVIPDEDMEDVVAILRLVIRQIERRSFTATAVVNEQAGGTARAAGEKTPEEMLPGNPGEPEPPKCERCGGARVIEIRGNGMTYKACPDCKGTTTT